MKKRLFIAALVLCMLAGILPAAGAAGTTTGSCGENVTWTLTPNSDGEDTYTLTISGTGAMEDYDEWKRPGWYGYYDRITKVFIEEGVTTVSSYFGGIPGFNSMSVLKRATLPSTVKEIGACAFYGCGELGIVNLPKKLETIGAGAFDWCSKLTSLEIPATVTDIPYDIYTPFLGCDWLHISVAAGNPVYKLVDGALRTKEYDEVLLFYNRVNNIANYTIPSNIATIGYGAFYGCKTLKSITMSPNVTEIGGYAFMNCTNLETIDWNGARIATIPGYAFSGCSSLKSLTIPEGVTEIECNAFCGYDTLTHLTLPDSLIVFNNNCFGEYPPDGTDVTIPAGVTCFTAEYDGPPDGYDRDDDTLGTITFRFQGDAPEEFVLGVCSNVVIYYPEGASGWDEIITRFTEYWGGQLNFIPYTPTSSGSTAVSEPLNFSLIRTAVTLTKGRTAILRYTVSPQSAAVTWSSSNTAVATVNSAGRVTAVKPGSAVITATASTLDGQKVVKTCAVTVNGDAKVTFKDHNVTLLPGKSVTLTCTVLPKGTPVTLTSSNSSVLKISGNTAQAVSAGNAVVTATITVNGEKKTDTCSVTVATDVNNLAQQFADEAKKFENLNRSNFMSSMSAELGETLSGNDVHANAWCVDFVNLCAKAVGINSIVPDDQSYIPYWVPDLINAGATRTSTPQVGDIAIMNGAAHTGIVVGVDTTKEKVYVVHGNYHSHYGDGTGWVCGPDCNLFLGSGRCNGTGGTFSASGKGAYDYNISYYLRPDWAAASGTTNGKLVVTYHCPIHVRVSYDGEVLDSATEQLEASFGAMELLADGGIRVTLDNYFDVDTEITGTGEGIMGLTAAFEDEDGTASTCSFENVPITSGTVGKLYTGAAGSTTYLELYENEGEDFAEAWSVEANGTATARDEELTAWYLYGDAPGGSELPFTDVATDAWYYDAVAWAVENGITTGTSDTTFSPDKTCTRAEVVTFLWRAAGFPEPVGTTNAFTDVAAGSYYETAVQWAVENGITEGTGDTTFSPDEIVSRGQVVTFLHRYTGEAAVSTVNPFADVAEDVYYTDAVLWAVAEGVTTGTSDTTFSPDKGCTRAEIVTFLYRALAE